MRTTQEETQRNDRKILDAAIRIFTEKGYADVNMQDIADELGVTRGPLYYRYKSKADLFEAALRQSCEDYLAEYTRILTQDRPFEEALRELLHYGMRNFMVERYSMSELASRKHPEHLQNAFELSRRYNDQFQQLIVDAAHRAIDRGELRADTDIHQLLITLSVYARGLYETIHETDMIEDRKDIDACIEDAIYLIRARCGSPETM